MGCEVVRTLCQIAPPLDGEGLGWGGVSGKVSLFIDSTPTQPSPIEGEGFTLVELT